MTTTNRRSNASLIAILAAPFRSRPRGLLDRRTLSAHLQRDLGLLDGHASPGSIR